MPQSDDPLFNSVFDGTIDPEPGWPDVPSYGNGGRLKGGPDGEGNANAGLLALAARTMHLLDNDKKMAGIDGFVTPERFSGNLQSAINFCQATNAELRVFKSYTIDAPLLISQPIQITIGRKGKISASDAFSGTSVIQVGSPSALAELVIIEGGGTVDARLKCGIAIDFSFARFSKLKLKEVIGGVKRAVRIGDPLAPAASYEVDCSGVTAWLGDVANTEDSIAIYHEKATDCYAHECIGRGYRKHFVTSSAAASIEYHMCHGWNRPVNGPLTHVFDDNGSQTTFVQCYADTPTNYGDSSITEVFGWRLNGFSPQLLACRGFINQALTPNIAVFGLVKLVHFTKEVYGNIFGLKAAGGSASMKYASIVSGPKTTSTIMGLVDDGPSSVVDAESRKENYTNQKIFEFINGLKINSFASITGPAGTPLPFSLQRGGIDRIQLRLSGNAEDGTNSGSDFQINAHADDGSFLATLLQINRKFKKLQAIEGMQISKQLEFANSYTVATLPVGEPRGLIYVNDGNAGQPCLAVFVGGAWKRIAIGNAVSIST